MKIKPIVKFKRILKNKILFGDYVFKLNHSSEFYYLYYNNFNKDIWKNIIKFIYPEKNKIIKWKKYHISHSYAYISLFKYLYKNSNNLNNTKYKYVINFLKKRYNYLKVVRDLYYLQYKLYQKDINPKNFKFENDIIKYRSS